MSTTPTPADTLLAQREAWIAKGRPADPADPYWAGVLASEAERTDPRRERTFVTPLVIFG